MIDKMYWACSEVMTLATQLATATDLPAQDVLQRRIAGLFEQMARRAQEARIPEEDITEARYALCAFIDEQILRSPWAGRHQWMSRPLQLIYFNENTAGEGFFYRLQSLQQQPHRLHVLQIYYLCLVLGFRGRYAVRGGEELSALIEHVSAQLARALPSADVISPHGEPRDAQRAFVKREAPIVALSLVLFGLALAVFIVLKIIIGVSASGAASDINRSAQVQGAPTATVKP